MSSGYNSPARSPGSSRLQLGGGGGGGGGVSRLRSSLLKKPPEPLRRAVADCLSASAAATSHHGTTSSTVLLSEASRILRDYLAAPSTMDLSYNVILEHTIAERERRNDDKYELVSKPALAIHLKKRAQPWRLFR